MDFTLKIYKKLLIAMKLSGYSFKTLEDYLKSPSDNTIILRHDVDLLPYNALEVAEIENSLGIKSSYYFRAVPESYDLGVMLKIQDLSHEIGYHYEDVDLVRVKEKLDTNNQDNREILINKSYQSFYNIFLHM